MTRRLSWNVRVALALATCVALLVAAAVPPASAGSMWFYKSSGRIVSTSWLEVGELPGPVLGNIHFGFMSIEDLGRGRANIWGEVIDMECPEGVIPDHPWGGPHGFEDDDEFDDEPDNGCVHVDFRWIDGGNVTFTMDNKLTKATLTGTLNVFGHEASGSPVANITWTGIGDTYKSTESGRWTDGTSSYSYRYSFSGRDAVVSGNIGAMIFDDADGEWSNAQMGSYRQMDRGRTR